MALGAIASIATLVAGALTANPLLIAGGIIGTVMLVNSIVSEATDGKASLGAAIAELAKKCGASENAAKWIGFAVEMAIVVTGAIFSIAGAIKGVTAAAAKAAEAAELASELAIEGTAAAAKTTTLTAAKAIAITTTATTILSGLNSVGQGIVQTIAATYDYKIDMAKAELQDLQAILEKVLAAMKSDEDIVEAIMEKTQDLFGKVKEIVQDNIAAQTAILTGSSPGMA
jgi:hypothetical protein